jgi:hypothetical protein
LLWVASGQCNFRRRPCQKISSAGHYGYQSQLLKISYAAVIAIKCKSVAAITEMDRTMADTLAYWGRSNSETERFLDSFKALPVPDR